MAGDLQPLDQQFPIVDDRGQPTQYFIKWAQQRQIDISNATDSDQVAAAIAAYCAAHPLQEGNGIALTPDGNLTDKPSISVRNGTGLDFDAMHNLKLKDTAVTPGAYTSANITVDQQGRITAAANGSGGGGGGMGPQGFLTASPPDPATYTLVGANPAGTITTYLASNYFNILLPVSAVSSAKYTKALPAAAPYNTYCAVSLSGDGTTGNDIQVGYLDASNNYVRRIRFTMVSSFWRWTVSSGAADLKTLTGTQSFGVNATLFMRIQNDGVNLKYYYSLDNAVSWLLFFTEAVSGISTAAKLYFQTANASGAVTFGATFWALYTV